METLLRELRQAERSVRRDRTFAAAAVLTLALGIGATTAVFSVLYGVLLAPLPYPDGESIVRIWSSNVRAGIPRGPSSGSDFADFRNDARSLAALSLTYEYEGTMEDDEGNPVRVPGYAVASDFFDVFRVPMTLGRGFTPDEDAGEGAPEAVLSHAIWASAFGSDPGVVGRSVFFEGGDVTVVGIAPPGFHYPRNAALWVAPRFNWANQARRARNWDLVGRMAPGATLQGTQTELGLIAARLESEHPQWNAGFGVEVAPLKEALFGDLRTPLRILMVASLALLLIATANVANLLLARGATRLRETALRAALGASRWRIVRGLLAESLVLAVGGVLLGVGLALGAIRLFDRLAPPSVSVLGDVSFGWQAMAYALGMTAGATLLFGLLPAVRASTADLRSLLGEGGRGAASGGGGAVVRQALVVAEVALATTLVIGTGLLLRSYRNISETDPGFDTGPALVFDLAPPMVSFSEWPGVIDFYNSVESDLATLPGARAVALTSSLPLGTQLDLLRPVQVLDLAPPEPGSEPMSYMRSVTPSFFQAFGVRVLEGRAFTAADHGDAAPVAVVNRTFVRRYLPDGRALNRRVRLFSTNFNPLGRVMSDEVEIVGVIDDVRYGSLVEEPAAAIYFPFAQAPFRRMTVLLGAAGDPMALAPAARERVLGISSRVAPSRPSTMGSVLAASTVSQRFTASLLLVFGLTALALAVVGIYGVVSYQATERRTEMAIRMALGAAPAEVMKLILLEGGRLAGAGILIGAGGALLFRRVLASQLYGVAATDPGTFLAAGFVLGAIALVASAAPAVRTGRVEPALTLRRG